VGRQMQDSKENIGVLNHYLYRYGNWDCQSWDAIIHLAPVLPDRVIDCAKECGARILYASSGAVYHTHPNEYGKMKISGERMLAESGVDYVVARMFAFMGPHMKWDNFAVGNFIRDACAGGPIRIQGSGQVVRSYLYASDMAAWLWKILLEGKRGETYDVGSEIPTTTLELAQVIAHHACLDCDIIIENRIKEEQAPVYLPRMAWVTRAALNVRQTIGLDEMIDLTIKAYREEQHAKNLP